MARLRWSVAARRDLRSIRDYIGADSPQAAQLLVQRLIEIAAHLRRFPSLGRVVPEFRDDALRELIYENYRIVYVIRRDDVNIVRVIHSAMDIRRIAHGGP